MFHFKKFSIEDKDSAMKIGTDGVLLGAWANVENSKHILDIGTGSGLIALMLAQRNPNAKIIGIDIDKKSVQQATENVKNSSWKEIDIQHLSLQKYSLETQNALFDKIISNPPFHETNNQIKEKARKNARQKQELSFEDLFYYSRKLLAPTGVFSLIIPFESYNKIWIISQQNEMFLKEKCLVYSTIYKKPKRVLLSFSLQNTNPLEKKLVIHQQGRLYTQAYQNLTKNFYLNF